MLRSYRVTIVLFALVLTASPLLGSSVTSVRAQDANVAGNWTLTMETPQGVRDINLTFTQEELELGGTIELMNSTRPLTGKVEGNKVTFSFAVPTPQGTFTLDFAGTVEENKKISGTMNSSGGQFPTTFTAEKKEQG